MQRALSVCTEADCPNLSNGGRCDECRAARRQAVDSGRGSASSRGYGSGWRRVRGAYLKRYPDCSQPGCTRPATDVDHVVALRDGGTHAWPNLRSYCHEHHSQRTARDQPGGWAQR